MDKKLPDDIQPQAVMTPDEQARWDALAPEEQLARLRAAIDAGTDNGTSDLSMDEIWARIQSRQSDVAV